MWGWSDRPSAVTMLAVRRRTRVVPARSRPGHSREFGEQARSQQRAGICAYQFYSTSSALAGHSASYIRHYNRRSSSLIGAVPMDDKILETAAHRIFLFAVCFLMIESFEIAECLIGVDKVLYLASIHTSDTRIVCLHLSVTIPYEGIHRMKTYGPSKHSSQPGFPRVQYRRNTARALSGLLVPSTRLSSSNRRSIQIRILC